MSERKYTYEVLENIGTSGARTTNAMRYRWHIRNADGDIVKTGYQFTATLAGLAAQKAMEKIERKGGTWIERALAKKRT